MPSEHKVDVQKAEMTADYISLRNRPIRIGFLLLPDFSMIAFTSSLEPLRAANRMSGKQLYQWQILCPEGGNSSSSNGITVSGQFYLNCLRRLDRIVICGGNESHLYKESDVLHWLRRMDTLGAQIGAISDGTYVLARAGLLHGSTAAIHWSCLEGFREQYPDIHVRADIYVINERSFTCSGGTAAMDLVLKLIQNDYGLNLSQRIADYFILSQIRDGEEKQRNSIRYRLGNYKRSVIRVVELMEQNLESPLPLETIAREAGISLRQMQRQFENTIKYSPLQYYQLLRLRRAKSLLEHTGLSITEVSMACGFSSNSHFSKQFRRRYKSSPSGYRKLECKSREELAAIDSELI